MTKEKFAEIITGREYPFSRALTEDEEQIAKDSNLLVIFGESDDLVELRGAINDEVGCSNGGSFYVDATKKRVLQELDDDDRELLTELDLLEVLHERRAAAIKIDALWCKDPPYSWSYAASALHATFDVMEDGEPYCRGIVIGLSEVYPKIRTQRN